MLHVSLKFAIISISFRTDDRHAPALGESLRILYHYTSKLSIIAILNITDYYYIKI